MENLTSQWNAEKGLLATRLSGDVTKKDVEIWQEHLHVAVDQIPDNSSFKILVDLHGFKAVDFDAHKRYRVVVPQLLAKHGWRIGYLDMFEEANDLKITKYRNVQCVGAAHVHHDASKIEKYQSLFSHNREQYFTDPEKGREWIELLMH